MSKEPLIRIAVAAVCGMAALATHVRRVDAGGCQTYQCGGNSPIVLGQPLANLRLDGVAQGGVQLVPDSLTNLTSCPRATGGRRAAADRLRLSIGPAAGELIAVDGNRTVCSGRGLSGATFQVVVTPPAARPRVGAKLPKPVTMTLRIAEVDRMRTWAKEPGQRHLLWSYRFEIVEAGTTIEMVKGKPVVVALPPNRPLCTSRVAHEEFQDFEGADAIADGQDIDAGRMENPRHWTTPTDHALIVRGEAFDETTGDSVRMPDAGFDYSTFFNIACMGTGVAKMRLLGIDPMDRSLRPGATVATLKMFGARYDGRTAETTPGTPLMWTRWDGVQFFGGPKQCAAGVARGTGGCMVPGPTEAIWDEHGARCLSHFRPPYVQNPRTQLDLSRIEGAHEANAVKRRQRRGGVAPCDQAVVDATRATFIWITQTVNHPEHGLTLPDVSQVPPAGAVLPAPSSGTKPSPMVPPSNAQAPTVKPPTPSSPMDKPPMAKPPTVISPPITKPPAVK